MLYRVCCVLLFWSFEARDLLIWTTFSTCVLLLPLTCPLRWAFAFRSFMNIDRNFYCHVSFTCSMYGMPPPWWPPRCHGPWWWMNPLRDRWRKITIEYWTNKCIAQGNCFNFCWLTSCSVCALIKACLFVLSLSLSLSLSATLKTPHPIWAHLHYISCSINTSASMYKHCNLGCLFDKFGKPHNQVGINSPGESAHSCLCVWLLCSFFPILLMGYLPHQNNCAYYSLARVQWVCVCLNQLFTNYHNCIRSINKSHAVPSVSLGGPGSFSWLTTTAIPKVPPAVDIWVGELFIDWISVIKSDPTKRREVGSMPRVAP